MDEQKIIHNTREQRFEIHIGGELAFLEYRLHDGYIAFMHTEVPAEFAGKGIAGSLATYAFNYAREKELPVKVYCPFVATFLKRHPEYLSQVIK